MIWSFWTHLEFHHIKLIKCRPDKNDYTWLYRTLLQTRRGNWKRFVLKNQLSTYIFKGFSFRCYAFQKAHPAKSIFNTSKKWHVAIETSFQTQPFPSIPTRIDSVVLGVCFHIGIRQVVVIDIIATWTYKYHVRGETCQELWYFVIGLLLSIGKIGVYGQRNESWIMWTISKLTWPHGI